MTGVSGTAAGSLEGVSPTLTYYVGSTPSGNGSSTAPSTAGTYTVVATFAGSTDYTSASSSNDLHDHPGHADGQRDRRRRSSTAGLTYPATATVTGVSGTAASLEGVSPTFTYYVGSTPSGNGSSTAPSAVGTYTVVAAFAGSADYTSASSSTTFTITAAAPTVSGISPASVRWRAAPR